MKNLLLAFTALAAILLASCSDDHFTIKGSIANGGTQSVRIVYALNDNIVSEWITLIDSKFTFEGASPEPTIVYVISQQRKIIAHLLVKNGDKIEISGDFDHPYRTRVKGNKTNERWHNFIVEHASLMEKRNPNQFDENIEEYISQNPNDVVSTLLLFNDYSSLMDDEHTRDLLSMISAKAQPEAVMKNYYIMQSMLIADAKKQKFNSTPLFNPRDSVENFAPYRNRLNLIYFWYSDDRTRKKDVEALKEFYNNKPSWKLTIVDINLDTDTTKWKKCVRGDSAEWKRFWASGGIMNRQLANLRLSSTPYYMVVDSAGMQVYRGRELNQAIDSINSRLKPRKKSD